LGLQNAAAAVTNTQAPYTQTSRLRITAPVPWRRQVSQAAAARNSPGSTTPSGNAPCVFVQINSTAITTATIHARPGQDQSTSNSTANSTVERACGRTPKFETARATLSRPNPAATRGLPLRRRACQVQSPTAAA